MACVYQKDGEERKK